MRSPSPLDDRVWIVAHTEGGTGERCVVARKKPPAGERWVPIREAALYKRVQRGRAEGRNIPGRGLCADVARLGARRRGRSL